MFYSLEQGGLLKHTSFNCVLLFFIVYWCNANSWRASEFLLLLLDKIHPVYIFTRCIISVNHDKQGLFVCGCLGNTLRSLSCQSSDGINFHKWRSASELQLQTESEKDKTISGTGQEVVLKTSSRGDLS